MEEVEELIVLGGRNRTVGDNNVNEHSSRSHLVLQVCITIMDSVTGNMQDGRLNLIDLAGSERIKVGEVFRRSEKTDSQPEQKLQPRRVFPCLGHFSILRCTPPDVVIIIFPALPCCPQERGRPTPDTGPLAPHSTREGKRGLP